MKRYIYDPVTLTALILIAITYGIPLGYADSAVHSEAEAGENTSGDRTVALADLISAALQQNPDIISAKADWLAAKKRVWVESSLPDPMGGFDLMGSMKESRVGPEQNRMMFSQEIPFPLKIWQRSRMANDEAHAALARYLATQRDVVSEMKKLYYELYYVDSSIQTIEEVKDILKKFEGVAEARYANNSGTQRDVAKAQAEVSLSLQELFTLRHQREVAAAMIQAMLDQDPLAPIGSAVKPEPPTLKYSLIELVNLAAMHRQEIKEMEAMVSRSRREKTLAKLDLIPDLNVGFDYTFVGEGQTTEPPDMDGRDSWMFPLRINLPIWPHKNIAAIQEAQKKLEATEARLKKARNTTFAEVKRAYHLYSSATEIVQLYETAVIPQAKLALSADQAGYESGKVDFLNLLDSERVYLNAKLTYIQLFTEALKNYADLSRATGLDFEQSDTQIESQGVHV